MRNSKLPFRDLLNSSKTLLIFLCQCPSGNCFTYLSKVLLIQLKKLKRGLSCRSLQKENYLKSLSKEFYILKEEAIWIFKLASEMLNSETKLTFLMEVLKFFHLFR